MAIDTVTISHKDKSVTMTKKEFDELPEKIAAMGHNSKADPVAAKRLKSYIERIERLISDRDAINTDIKEVFLESKSAGFDQKAMRRIIAERKKDEAKRQEEQYTFDTYAQAVGLTY